MSQLLKSSGAMSAATMLSRVLGLVREMAYAWFMGSSWVADAFTLAYMVPNLFRRLLGEGALTAAFIPIFKEKEKTAGETEMWRAANAVVSGLTLATTVLVAFCMVLVSAVLAVRFPVTEALQLAGRLGNLAPILAVASGLALAIHWLAPSSGVFWPRMRQGVYAIGAGGGVVLLLGFVAIWVSFMKQAGGGKTLLMLELLRIMFPYLILVCIAAIFMGMLNARGHFFVPAMGATMLNVVMISSVVLVKFLGDRQGWKLEQQIFGLAIGVVVAGLAQAFFQYPLLRQDGFHYQWIPPWRDAIVRRVITQMIPGTIGVAAFQINVLITQGMAFWVDSGVVSSFSYAVRLMELPQGVFGISLATYLLPTLSGLAAEKKYPEFRQTLAQGVGWLVFINLLASVLLLTLAEPMVRLLFERGKFDAEATMRSARALACLAPGLVAFSIVNILARAFYAVGDTRTPMHVSVFCLSLNIVLSAALVFPFREAGLGLANTLTSLINVTLLLYGLRRKLKTLAFDTVRRTLPPLVGAALVAGGLSWAVARAWTHGLGHGNFWLKAGEVFVPMTVASVAYLGLTVWLKTGHADELFRLVRGRRFRAK